METATLTKPSSTPPKPGGSSSSSTTTTTSKPPHFLFPDPEVNAALGRYHESKGEARADEAALVRKLLDIPEGGPELRAWLGWLLKRVPNKKTGRAYTQADIGRLAGDASGATVSRVFQGELPGGELSDKVRNATADILKLPADVIWKPAAVCASCGSPLFVRAATIREAATIANRLYARRALTYLERHAVDAAREQLRADFERMHAEDAALERLQQLPRELPHYAQMHDTPAHAYLAPNGGKKKRGK